MSDNLSIIKQLIENKSEGNKFTIQASDFTSKNIQKTLTQFFGTEQLTFLNYQITTDTPEHYTLQATLQNPFLEATNLNVTLDFTSSQDQECQLLATFSNFGEQWKLAWIFNKLNEKLIDQFQSSSPNIILNSQETLGKISFSITLKDKTIPFEAFFFSQEMWLLNVSANLDLELSKLDDIFDLFTKITRPEIPIARDLPPISSIKLTHIGSDFVVSDNVIQNTYIILESNIENGGWKPLGDWLTFKKFKLQFYTGFYSNTTTVIAFTESEVLGKDIEASISLPDLDFRLTLGIDEEIEIGKLLSHLSIEIPGSENTNELKIICSSFSLAGNIKQSFYSIYCQLKDVLQINIGQTSLEIKELLLKLQYNSQESSGSLQAKTQIGTTEFTLIADYQTIDKSWDFLGYTNNEQSLSIDNLKSLAEPFGVENIIPSAIEDIKILNIRVSFNTQKKEFHFTCQGKFPIEGKDVNMGLEIDIIPDPTNLNSFTKNFEGYVTIGERKFELSLGSNSQSNTLVATYNNHTEDSNNTKEEPLSIHDLIVDISDEIADYIPTDLKITLKNALFAYSKIKQPNSDKSTFLFGLSLGLKIDLLENLKSIIGTGFSIQQTISVDKLQFLIASQNLNYTEVENFNKLITNDVKLPLSSNTQQQDAIAITKGFNISANLTLGDVATPLALPLSSAQSSNPPTSTNSPSESAIASTTVSDNTQWIEIQKNLGPIHFQRVGVQYQSANQNQKASLWFLLDASLSMSGLTLSLDGLAVGSPLTEFKPQFKLRGIGIAYDGQGTVDISGSFLKVKDKEEYFGQALLKTETFSIAAIGAYRGGDDPSLFVFGVLNQAIGGPPFFFITGLAGGFGYNRTLKTPTIEEVQNFPLIKAVTDPSSFQTIEQAYQQMDGSISPSTGEYWLAAGIRFTSFKMIDSFALITVKFGKKVEVNLLGKSTLTIPQGVDNPIAKAELVLKASFDPQVGLLAIDGQLTPNSYIFDQKCFLQGGFAFYSWFSGEHEGDFVITLGGYHPRFNKPAHYPSVPRLGFSWQVSNELTVKGGMYFALTPSALMAGGRLEATWQSGDLQAWFNVDTDFLINWKPFHYDVRLNVSMGVAYTVDLWFTSFRVSVHLGVELHIFGPPFSGTARIDLSVISFTIAFGDRNSSPPQPLSWEQFAGSFLPDEKSIVTLQVSDGLIKDLRKEQDHKIDYVINPYSLTLITQTAIPTQTAIYNDSAYAVDHIHITLAVRPMGNNGKILTSEHSIKITYEGKVTDKDSFILEPIKSNSSKAMWGNPEATQESIISDSETLIKGTLIGFKITPKPNHPPDTLPEIDLNKLQFSTINEPKKNQPKFFSWTNPEIVATESFDQSQAMTQLQNTINGSSILDKRKRILSSLSNQGFLMNPEIDVGNMAKSAQDVLLASPILSHLGERK